MGSKLRPGRGIRFMPGFAPYARCIGDPEGAMTSWAEITEITLLPTGWVQVEHDDNTTMFYPQQVIASLKNPLVL